MGQIAVSKIGKKGAIYIPKHVFERLGISEGSKVLMKVEGNNLLLEFIPDPLTLALNVKKWAKTTVKEFEEESAVEQNEFTR